MNDFDDALGTLILAISFRHSLEEIQSIVEADPSLLRRRWNGDLPLHYAVNGPWCRPEVVRYLLEQWPESVREWSTSESNEHSIRRLPIHLAAGRRLQLGEEEEEGEEGEDDTIQILVEAWPGSTSVKDWRGRLPLHEAHHVDDIRCLHEAYPAAIDEPDEHGMLALHLAVEEGYPLESLTLLTELSPSSVRAKDDQGRIPLHCVSESTRIEAVQLLVDLWEDSVHLVDEEGRLPLHYAAGADYSPNPAAVRFLVGRAPSSARARTHDGNLALHVALEQKGMDVQAIQALVGAWLESVREKTQDEEALLPLHVAAQTGGIDNVQFLVESYPESVRERTATGWLAVHLALKRPYNPNVAILEDDSGAHYATARFLLDQFPESITERTTREGYLPLHVAAQSGYGGITGHRQRQEVGQTELEVLQYLIQLAPLAACVASHELLFPANYAVSVGLCTLESTQFLFQQFSAAINQRNARGQNVLQMSIDRFRPRLEIVQYLADLRPQMLREKDRNGSTALHAVVARPRSQGFSDHGREIAQFLVDRRAQSLRKRDRLGALPLHVAMASYGPDLDMVRLLVEAHPESVGATNARGQLPLHVLVAHHGETALPVVVFLVEQRPKALQEADNVGSLPIHVAVARREPSMPVVSFLIEQRPQTLLIANSHGFLPLHAAVAQGSACPIELVQLLVEKCPDSVQHKDTNGCRPLMVAASANADLSVLFVLATQWPDAVRGMGVGSGRTFSESPQRNASEGGV